MAPNVTSGYHFPPQTSRNERRQGYHSQIEDQKALPEKQRPRSHSSRRKEIESFNVDPTAPVDSSARRNARSQMCNLTIVIYTDFPRYGVRGNRNSKHMKVLQIERRIRVFNGVSFAYSFTVQTAKMFDFFIILVCKVSRWSSMIFYSNNILQTLHVEIHLLHYLFEQFVYTTAILYLQYYFLIFSFHFLVYCSHHKISQITIFILQIKRCIT